MRTVALLLVCLSCAYSEFSSSTLGKEDDPAKMLASLLLARNPQAAASIPQVNGELESALKKDVGGLPFEVPVKFDGKKVTTGLSFNVKGVKVEVPLSFLIHELANLGKLSASDLKTVKTNFEHPSGMAVSYPEGTVKYQFKFEKNGWEFKLPLSTTLSKLSELRVSEINSPAGLVTASLNLLMYLLSILTGKLTEAFKFDVGGRSFEVPVKFDGEKVTAGLSTTVKGLKLALPISFLLSSLSGQHLGEVAHRSQLDKLTAEMEHSVDANGLPVTVPVKVSAGKVEYPLKFHLHGWDLTVPLSYRFGKTEEE